MKLQLPSAWKTMHQGVMAMRDEIFSADAYPKKSEPKKKADLDYSRILTEAESIRSICDMIIAECGNK